MSKNPTAEKAPQTAQTAVQPSQTRPLRLAPPAAWSMSLHSRSACSGGTGLR